MRYSFRKTMNYEHLMKYLSASRAFRGAHVEWRHSVAKDHRLAHFVRNSEVLSEGCGPCEEGYLILHGTAEVFIENELVATLREGDIFGEYAPVFDRHRSASVVSKSDLSCLVLRKRELLQLIGMGTGLNRLLLARIAENRKQKRGVFREW